MLSPTCHSTFNMHLALSAVYRRLEVLSQLRTTKGLFMTMFFIAYLFDDRRNGNVPGGWT